MNVVILKGRFSKDPEMKTITKNNKETKYVSFTLAVAKENGVPGVEWINCIVWGKLSETIIKYFKKGKEILVRGHWTTGSYKGSDNKTVYSNTCTVEKFEFCGEKDSSAEPIGNFDPSAFDETIPFN